MSFNVFFHPFFQILDDPFPSPSPRSRQPSQPHSQSQSPQSPSRQTPAPSSPSHSQNNNVFEGPIFNSTRRLRSPAVEVNEEKDQYVVEAELPGVRKEDVDVRIGDGGRSLTIEGRSVRRFGRGVEASAEPAAGTPAQDTKTNTNTNTDTTKPPEADQQVSNSDNKTQTRNRDSDSNFVGTNRSVFSRTVWLPRPVDAKNVQAGLDHGVLTLRIPKAAEGTTRIPIL